MEKLDKNILEDLYLFIQRAKFEDDSFKEKKGIDSILDFAYMGSSEFENGGLFQSLKKIRSIDYSLCAGLDIYGKEIAVYAPTYLNPNVTKTYLEQIADHVPRFKEFSDFDNWCKPSKSEIEWQEHTPHNTDFWWDIENHIMWWKNDVEFTKKFLKVIRGNNE